MRLRCVGASQCCAAEHCSAGRGAAINTVEHQWRGHVCSAVFSVEGKVWERLIPRVSQSSLSLFHLPFCWCVLFQRVFPLMCLASSFPRSHSLKLFYSAVFVKHKAPYLPLPSPLPCSTFSLSPVSVCFMQNNWFRKLFIHILHVPRLIRSWSLWVTRVVRYCHSDLSGGSDNTSADFGSGVPLVMGKLKMAGCRGIAQTRQALGEQSSSRKQAHQCYC